METTDRLEVEKSRKSGHERRGGSCVVFTDVYQSPYLCGAAGKPLECLWEQ